MIILIVLEPQASGSWHLHGLVKKKNGSFPFVKNEVVASMWRQGFTKTKKLKDSDNISAYLMAYLTDMPKEDILADTKNNKKSIIKGARLHFYPSGVHIYRNSRGLRQPVKIRGSKKKILEKYHINVSRLPDAAFKHEHKLKDGRKVHYLTEFYDDLNENKKVNHARQDND